MRIVFWLNSLSPHQIPYIVHLKNDNRIDSVIIVVNEIINNNRKNMGWDITSIPGIEKCEIIVNPNNDKINTILSYRTSDSYHLFSGIRGFKFIYNAFKTSLNYNIKRGIITERPNTYAFGNANGKPLWLHKLRWLIQDYKYIKYVNYVFAIGEQATIFFKSISNKWKVFPFMYCTHQDSRINNIISPFDNTTLNLVYVGGLSWWKSVDSLLYSINKLNKSKATDCKIQLTIIGDGPERNKLEKIVNINNIKEVKFLGSQKQSNIQNLISDKDILILPSVYDGWGAVVNEALQVGLYIICSDKCGSKDLLKDKRCGTIFQAGNVNQLSVTLQNCINNIKFIRENKKYRYMWAKKNISGEAIAKYFIDCLDKNNELIEQPWRKTNE